MDKNTVKDLCMQVGAKVVGIASPDSFSGAPKGFHPVDKLKTCRSVIVLGCPFPQEALSKNTVEYTTIRNEMVKKLDDIAQEVSDKIKTEGYKTKIIKGLGGKWDNGRFRGLISLKHAAELAGIGTITRNYLLTNPVYGNMLWFSAVLTNAEIEPDLPMNKDICITCRICIDICPSGALDNKLLFEQKACYRTCYIVKKGILELKCFECRKVCPYRFGIPNS